MNGVFKDKKAEAEPFRSIKAGSTAEIFREQELESDLEKLWMDGDVFLNEEEPKRRSLRI